jgi:hypothetical protein
MMRWSRVLVCIAAWSGIEAQARNSSTAALEAEFLRREFTVKIPIGIYYTYFNRTNQRQLMRNVETLVHADGRMEDVVGPADLDPSSAMLLGFSNEPVSIAPGALTDAGTCAWGDVRPEGFSLARCKAVSIPTGARVRVSRWSWKNDRVSLELSVGLGTPTLTFVFGRDFRSSATRDRILRVISFALSLPEFERAQRTMIEYDVLKQRLGPARLAVGAASGTQRIAVAESLVVVLRALIANSAILGSAVVPESERLAFDREAAVTDSLIKSLRASAREARLSLIRSQLAANASVIDSLLSTVQAATPATVVQWRNQQLAIDSSRRILEMQRQLIAEQVSLGDARVAEAESALARYRMRSDSVATFHESRRGALERSQSDVDFRGMERARSSQRDAYTRAFGTAAFVSEGNKYIEILQRMYENRTAAAKAGSTAAAAQAAALQKEIDQTRQRIRR